MIMIIPVIEDYIEAYETEGATVLINDGRVVGVCCPTNEREEK